MYRAVKHYFFAITGTPSILKIIKTHRAKQKPSVNRPTLASRITGWVLCFNVHKGFDFIHRVDKGSNIFVYHTEIIKNNSNKFFRSLAKGAVLQFDVVLNIKN